MLPVHFRWAVWPPTLTLTLFLTRWQILSRSICWNWHIIPHKVGSRGSRKQACSGGNQKGRKPVPNRTRRRAALLIGAEGTNCSHVPWSFVANFTSRASLQTSHPYLEKAMSIMEAVPVTSGWSHFSVYAPKFNAHCKRLCGQKRSAKIE